MTALEPPPGRLPPATLPLAGGGIRRGRRPPGPHRRAPVGTSARQTAKPGPQGTPAPPQPPGTAALSPHFPFTLPTVNRAPRLGGRAAVRLHSRHGAAAPVPG